MKIISLLSILENFVDLNTNNLELHEVANSDYIFTINLFSFASLQYLLPLEKTEISKEKLFDIILEIDKKIESGLITNDVLTELDKIINNGYESKFR